MLLKRRRRRRRRRSATSVDLIDGRIVDEIDGDGDANSVTPRKKTRKALAPPPRLLPLRDPLVVVVVVVVIVRVLVLIFFIYFYIFLFVCLFVLNVEMST